MHHYARPGVVFGGPIRDASQLLVDLQHHGNSNLARELDSNNIPLPHLCGA